MNAKALAIVALSFCYPMPAQSESVLTFGLGNSSCATWLSSKQLEGEGFIWIMGAWSGMNFRNAAKDVGHSTDARGLTAAVRKFCEQDPAMKLASAIDAVYLDFQKRGR